MPSLVHFTLDPFSRRLRLALAEYGVPVELIEEAPWEPSADIFELNPAGTLPVYLEDAATPLCGIEAIGEYLEETKSSRGPSFRAMPSSAPRCAASPAGSTGSSMPRSPSRC
jgi:glutathione S-transferase